MKNKRLALPLLVLWGGLTLWAWFHQPQQMSDSERRNLAQMPKISAETLLDGTFARDFESYTLDQFPLRDRFRQGKALFHYYVLGQKDNNGIYLCDGYAAQQMRADDTSLAYAMSRLQKVYESYLTDSRVVMAVVPDKGCYLAQSAGQPTLDYDRLLEQVEAAAPWAEHVDLRPWLSLESYYRTDTHWRQETLLPVAQAIGEALGEEIALDYTLHSLERPFYGVYYGQAALPMAPDTLVLMENEMLDNCTVYDYETGKTGSVYDLSKLESKDLYDVYLSGARAMLTITNPAGDPQRELLIFRDSYGSSLAPLLVGQYGKVTLIDLRYISADILDRFLTFQGQDTLFLMSTLLLNDSSAIK